MEIVWIFWKDGNYELRHLCRIYFMAKYVNANILPTFLHCDLLGGYKTGFFCYYNLSQVMDVELSRTDYIRNRPKKTDLSSTCER